MPDTSLRGCGKRFGPWDACASAPRQADGHRASGLDRTSVSRWPSRSAMGGAARPPARNSVSLGSIGIPCATIYRTSSRAPLDHDAAARRPRTSDTRTALQKTLALEYCERGSDRHATYASRASRSRLGRVLAVLAGPRGILWDSSPSAAPGSVPYPPGSSAGRVRPRGTLLLYIIPV